MIGRDGAVAFLALISCMIVAHAEPARSTLSGKIITVQMNILSDGTTHYSYNGREINAAERERLEADANKAHRQVTYELKVEEQAKSSPLYGIQNATRGSATHVGFTGIDQYPDPKSTHQPPTPPPRKAVSP